MSRRRLSLSARLLLLQVAVFGGLLLVAGPATYVVMSRALERDRDAYLVTLARFSTAEWQRRGGPAPAAREAGPPPCFAEPVPPLAAVAGATHLPRHLLVWDGVEVVCSDGESAPLAVAEATRALELGEATFGDVRWSAEVLRLVEWPLVGEDGRALVMEVGTSYRVIEGVVSEGLVFTLVIEAAALALLITGSWLLTRRAFAPIDTIVEALEQIDEANLAERLPEEALEDQVGRLVVVVNRMLERLERAFAQQRRFASDVAHEIRSPLTALRGQIEVALRRDRSPAEYRSVLSECLEEVVRLSRLATDMMSLARADAGILSLSSSRLDLGRLARRVLDRFRPQAAAKDVRLRLDAPEAVVVAGDDELLARAIANLVDNALRHSPRLEEVVVRVDGRSAGARVTVADRGPGIPAEHLPHIFDRFYRADPARSRAMGGAGLGLAIAREIVSLHGGTVEVESEVGVGSAFTLVLPLQAAGRDASPRMKDL